MPDQAFQHVDLLIQWNSACDGPLATARPIRSVAIIGAGIMGTGIAAANLRHGLPVVLTDANEKVLAAAPQRVAAEWARCQGQTASGHSGPPSGLIHTTTDIARIGACDLVVESVYETLADKQAVYACVEPHLGPAATLATNSSSIPIERLAAPLAEKGRFCGLHFFCPVHSRPLVEVVRGPQTSDQTVATAVAYARTIGKMPIVVGDGPGFLVNRLCLPYLMEALELVLDGAGIDQIERAATGFGMAMGPLRMLDEIGLDTVLLAGRVLWNAFPKRIEPSPLLVAMYKAGRLGRKSGLGFFRYPDGGQTDGPGQPDPQLGKIIGAWARTGQPFSDDAIIARLLVPMILEATRLLQEGKARDPRIIDLGAIFGLGFPACRGGLLYWADTLGMERILAMLGRLESVGPRLAPTPMLLEMARRGERFYGPAP